MGRLGVVVVFALALVVFAYVGHHIAPPAVKHLPLTTVWPDLCERNGHIQEVIVYDDDPATAHVRCSTGVWLSSEHK